MSKEHGSPVEGMMCLATMEDITVENYVEYQTSPSLNWHPCQYEQSVVDQLLKSKFEDFVQKGTDLRAHRLEELCREMSKEMYSNR